MCVFRDQVLLALAVLKWKEELNIRMPTNRSTFKQHKFYRDMLTQNEWLHYLCIVKHVHVYTKILYVLNKWCIPISYFYIHRFVLCKQLIILYLNKLKVRYKCNLISHIHKKFWLWINQLLMYNVLDCDSVECIVQFLYRLCVIDYRSFLQYGKWIHYNVEHVWLIVSKLKMKGHWTSLS